MNTDFDKLLLGETPDAIIATTPEGKVMYWSKGAQAMLGHTGIEALGRLVEEFVVPPDRVAEELCTGSAACRCSVSSEMAGVFPLPGFPQLTQSGRRLVRVPPFATAGFCRTHLPASVLKTVPSTILRVLSRKN
jgi:PAS domain-containing protein